MMRLSVFEILTFAFSLNVASGVVVVFTDSAVWDSAVSNEGLTVTADGFDDLDTATSDSNPLVRPHFSITRGAGEDVINVTAGTFSTPQSGLNYLQFTDPFGDAGDGAGEILIEFSTQQEAVSFYLGDLHDTAATSAETTVEVSTDGSSFSEVWKISGALGSNNSGSLQEVYSSVAISVGQNINTFIGFSDFTNGLKAIRITNTADNRQEQISMDTVAFTTVPEPSTFAALTGLIALLATRFSRKIPCRVNLDDQV